MKPRPPPQPSILPVLKPFPAMAAYGASDYLGQQCHHLAHGASRGKIRRSSDFRPRQGRHHHHGPSGTLMSSRFDRDSHSALCDPTALRRGPQDVATSAASDEAEALKLTPMGQRPRKTRSQQGPTLKGSNPGGITPILRPAAPEWCDPFRDGTEFYGLLFRRFHPAWPDQTRPTANDVVPLRGTRPRPVRFKISHYRKLCLGIKSQCDIIIRYETPHRL
jgi:hypothetical protein